MLHTLMGPRPPLLINSVTLGGDGATGHYLHAQSYVLLVWMMTQKSQPSRSLSARPHQLAQPTVPLQGPQASRAACPGPPTWNCRIWNAAL